MMPLCGICVQTIFYAVTGLIACLTGPFCLWRDGRKLKRARVPVTFHIHGTRTGRVKNTRNVE